jgi:hypothetical protein
VRAEPLCQVPPAGTPRQHDACPTHLTISSRSMRLPARSQATYEYLRGRVRWLAAAPLDEAHPRADYYGSAEITHMPGEHLAPPRTPAQRARTPRAAGEAISPSYPTALTRRKPPATRLSRPRIYICRSPRSRPHSRLLPLILSGTLLAISSTCCNDPGLPPHGLFKLLRMVCGSCGAPAAHANAPPRRALPSSPLRCRDRCGRGSGAGLLRRPVPFSPMPVRRSFRLWLGHISMSLAACERAEARAESVASARASHVRMRHVCARACNGPWSVRSL